MTPTPSHEPVASERLKDSQFEAVTAALREHCNHFAMMSGVALFDFDMGLTVDACHIVQVIATALSAPPAQVQGEAGEVNDDSTIVDLWAEIWRLRAAIKGPDGYASWQDAATAERVRRVKAERALAAPPTAQAAPEGCTRSHPHEDMDEACVLRTEIARRENAKAQAAPVAASEPSDALHKAIDAFEQRERGMAQAHIAAKLVAELRAALAAALPVEPTKESK